MSCGRPAGLTEFPRCGNNAPVIRGHRYSRFSAALLVVAAVGLAPGCTLLDDVLPGTPFTPDQPVAQVTVVGGINIDGATLNVAKCSAGSALLWGTAQNTGDLDVDDVFITIEALGANGAVLGTYRVHVFNGTVSGGTPTDPIVVAGTSLAVDESGSFSVCTNVPSGSVTGTAYSTDFIVVNEIQ